MKIATIKREPEDMVYTVEERLLIYCELYAGKVDYGIHVDYIVDIKIVKL